VSWECEMHLTPTETDTVMVAGRLRAGSSLYTALVHNPALEDMPRRERESLLYGLAEIYGWELNFATDMREGDTFRVVYEREVRPDGSARASRVLVAEIVNQNRPIPAILFDVDGNGGDYYTTEGKSLKLAFSRYPVDFPRITSNFARQRFHPVLQRNRPHLGTDFGAAHGTPVKTTADGTIAAAGWDGGGYGNLIRIDHGNGYETRYAHLSRVAPGIRRGTRVRQGQVIGYVGATGLATGPHLHYELRLYGQPTDSRTARLPAAPPVPEARMAEFRAVAQEKTVLLAAVALPDDGPVLAE
jgi:murein DD-endopeptidase MepM/ murein hydrolase activator NlpD